jgi:hypothetical protein
MTTFDPDKWITSLHRSLLSYMQTKLPADEFEIVEDYPSAAAMTRRMPLKKTIVHFAMEDPQRMMFGLGDNIVADSKDEDAQEIEGWEARCHEVTFDLGIWASEETGGVTSRMEAREALDYLFHGSTAQQACLAATDGVDVRSISGGRNVIEDINEIVVYRMVDIALIVRVYSRVKATSIPYVTDDLDLDPELTIDQDLTITG